MMTEQDATSIISIIATIFIIGGLMLNAWAFIIMRRIANAVPGGRVPEALRDRVEVTFWQLVSSVLIAIVAVASLYRQATGSGLWPSWFTVAILAFGLSIKIVPSSRWLYRYYNKRFEGDRPLE